MFPGWRLRSSRFCPKTRQDGRGYYYRRHVALISNDSGRALQEYDGRHAGHYWTSYVPGESTPLSGTTEAARPELAGLVLNDALQEIELFGIGPPVAVQIQLRVVRSDITGLLDFYYRILTGTSPLGTHADTVTIWLPPPAGITVTYADFRPDGLGTTAPDKFIYGAPDNKYTFIFSKDVPADTSTRFFFVSTNARDFSATGADLGDAELPGTEIIVKVPGPLAEHHGKR